MQPIDDAESLAAAGRVEVAGDTDVNVTLNRNDVLPRAPLLVRAKQRSANFVIEQEYAAYSQQAGNAEAKQQAKPSSAKPVAKPKVNANAKSDRQPAGLKSKRAADEFDQAFILHAYPYKETSLILETFTRNHGRVSMVARGAKRPHGALTSARNPFQPLNLVWTGKADLKTLKTAESGAIFPQLQGTALLSAFYLNELLLKLCAREDPQPALFDAYQATLQRLIEVHYRAKVEAQPAASRGLFPQDVNDANVAADFAHYAEHLKRVKRAARAGQTQKIAITLRQFELTLFQHLGFGLELQLAAHSGQPIVADIDYCYVVDQGAVLLGKADMRPAHGLQLRGKTLLDIAQANYDDATTLQQSKQLVRLIINHLLGAQVLHTRSLIAEFAELK